MDTTTVTFEIQTGYFHRFQEEFAKLVKRAAKLKVSTPTYRVIEEKVVPAVIGECGEVKSPAKFLKVISVTGQAPKLNGWTFIAVLQHEEAGNIVRKVPGCEAFGVDKDYRDAAPYCGHCKTTRRRNDTYVVANDDGRQLQIGRNCLKDFTGHESPESIARWAECLGCFVSKVSDEGDESFGGGSGKVYWGLVEFLGVVSAAIGEYGWLSRTKAREFGKTATVDYAVNYLTAPSDVRRKILPEVTPENVARGIAALGYAVDYFDKADEEGTELEDYQHNLRLIVQGGSCDVRSAGLAGSIVSFSERLQGKDLERKRAATSEYCGTVGKRETFPLEVVRVIDIESQYGVTHLHMLQDVKGNRFSWFASTESLDVGKTYAIKGTVKEHKLYIPRDAKPGFPGVKQTVLTRCKAVEAVV